MFYYYKRVFGRTWRLDGRQHFRMRRFYAMFMVKGIIALAIGLGAGVVIHNWLPQPESCGTPIRERCYDERNIGDFMP
jgi:hypothetical protein